jgi:hypothetical protein
LSTVGVADSFSRLSGTRPSVEALREATTQANGKYQFPNEIGKYWIALSFIQYSNFMNNAVKQKPGASIILPVPINLTDTSTLEYSHFNATGTALDAVSGIAQSVVNSGVLGKTVKGIFGSDSKISESAMGAVSAAAKTAGVDTGVALNTHQSLAFVQPVLKQHDFMWKLVPSSESESKKIATIINVIKKHIYPKANFLKFDYPALVNVYLFNADQMYLFKPAFIDSFSVNYTNETGPAFYKSSYPVAVTITMRIRENSVWTSEEFSNTESAKAGGEQTAGMSAMDGSATPITGNP